MTPSGTQSAKIELISVHTDSEMSSATETSVSDSLETVQELINKVEVGHLPIQELERFKSLISKFASLLISTYLTGVKNMEHLIQTQVCTRPSKCAPYRADSEARREIEQQVKYLHDKHTVTWHSPNELTFRYEVPHFMELVPHLSTPEISKSELFHHLEDNGDHIQSLMRQSQERNKLYCDRSVMHGYFDEGEIAYLNQRIPTVTPGLSRKLTKPRLEAYRVIGPVLVVFNGAFLHIVETF